MFSQILLGLFLALKPVILMGLLFEPWLSTPTPFQGITMTVPMAGSYGWWDVTGNGMTMAYTMLCDVPMKSRRETAELHLSILYATLYVVYSIVTPIK